MQFIQEDETQRETFVLNSFDCVQFSEALIKNAKEQGFDAIPVMVGWDSGDDLILHMFVAFNTSDGIIWIEPQNDREYVVSEKSLCHVEGDCIGDFRFVYYDGEFTHTVTPQE